MKDFFNNFFKGEVPTQSLAALRFLWGGLLVFSLIRFIAKGWVSSFYLEPPFFFSYWGFSWVKPWSQAWMLYAHFGVLIAAALGIALGFYYRLNTVLFFVGFTMVELWDKTTYLNHYYFISLISLILCFFPLHRAYSLDLYLRKVKPWGSFPKIYLRILQLQMALVYFFAGIAKLEPDWIFNAQPLRIWLSTLTDTPLLGPLFAYQETAYLMSWTGALFDLTVPFFLFNKKTRLPAYLALLFFHLLTYKLFNIGVFPWVMMIATLVFFEPDWPGRLLSVILAKARIQSNGKRTWIPIFSGMTDNGIRKVEGFTKIFFIVFFVLQILIPLRSHLYPGNVLWHEQGFRFSWRVMLMEKVGAVDFKLIDKQSNKTWHVSARDYLKPFQYRQMSTQPDMILEMAHYLKKQWQAKGYPNIQVYADARVSLNGRRTQSLIDPQVDLGKINDGLVRKTWIKAF